MSWMYLHMDPPREQVAEMTMNHIFRLDQLIPWQCGEPLPSLSRWSSKNTVNHIQLMDFIIALEHWFLGEKLQHDAAGQYHQQRAVREGTSEAYPALHISTSGPYTVAPKSNSGGRYHKVMTRLV